MGGKINDVLCPFISTGSRSPWLKPLGGKDDSDDIAIGICAGLRMGGNIGSVPYFPSECDRIPAWCVEVENNEREEAIFEECSSRVIPSDAFRDP
jgi:hypothetical protein